MSHSELPARSWIEEVAVAGLQDWTSASFLRTLVAEGTAPPAEPDLGPACLGVVAWMVLGGFAELGEVRSGFQPWPGTPGACLERAVASWLEAGGPHDLGDLFWLDNTPAGDALAREVLAREDRSGSERGGSSGENAR